MPLDPRTPVLVGAGQLTRHPSADELATVDEPATMMAEALRRAAEDSGARDRLLKSADSVRVVELLSWHYADPGREVAERIGAAPRQTLRTTTGGNSPQMLVNATASAIQRGELDVALLCGAEAVFTRLLARKAQIHLPWTPMASSESETVIGDDRPGTCDAESSRSLVLPVQIYPIFENAIRAATGQTAEASRITASELWASLSRVAAGNPYAWAPVAMTPEAIRTPAEDNRMIAFPYTKWMNANIQTDQAAAVILCSVDAARSAGVPEDRWVFPWSGADAHDHYFISERASLAASPAIAAAGRAALGLAGRTADELAHIDLYSCFPSAVQMAAAALGLAIDEPHRPLTVTGGLTFAGGPGNNYAMHAIATMADVLRNDPGSVGLVSALGWYVTKHALGVYSTTPPPDGYRHAGDAVQAEIDALPRRPIVAVWDGPAVAESFTVTYERDGTPSVGIVACLVEDGGRTWATTTDADLIEALLLDGLFGRPVRVAPDGRVTIA
jgi:acetyl-CoA C-acetyltransferase